MSDFRTSDTKLVKIQSEALSSRQNEESTMNPIAKRQKNKRWATVLVPGRWQICVLMLKDETEEELKTRVENSIWGRLARIIGIYSKPSLVYVKAEHELLPEVGQYVPEYKFDDFTRALQKADYQNVDITLITERGQKV